MATHVVLATKLIPVNCEASHDRCSQSYMADTWKIRPLTRSLSYQCKMSTTQNIVPYCPTVLQVIDQRCQKAKSEAYVHTVYTATTYVNDDKTGAHKGLAIMRQICYQLVRKPGDIQRGADSSKFRTAQLRRHQTAPEPSRWTSDLWPFLDLWTRLTFDKNWPKLEQPTPLMGVNVNRACCIPRLLLCRFESGSIR